MTVKRSLRDDLLRARSEVAAQKMKIDKLKAENAKMHENFKALAKLKMGQEKRFNKRIESVVEFIRDFYGPPGEYRTLGPEERLLAQVATAVHSELGFP